MSKLNVDQQTIDNYKFYNGRPITKSMLAWWAFQNDKQELLSLETKFEIEHIFARNRLSKEKGMKDKNNLDSLGNKSLLEKRINIRASDYRFADKTKYYLGFVNNKDQKKEGTKVQELIHLADNNKDFLESDIKDRYKKIVENFLAYLFANDLLRKGV